MIKKAGFYAIKQYFSATKLHFLIFIITFAHWKLRKECNLLEMSVG